MERSAMKKLIYTVNYGNYDYLLEPEIFTSDWDYVVVTDNINLKSKNWNILHYDEPDLQRWLIARKSKILVSDFFPEYDISIFIDAMYRVNVDLNEFIRNKINQSSDIAFAQHHERHCVYQEIKECYVKGKINQKYRDKIIKKYQAEQIPKDSGLFQCGCMIRWHNRENLDLFNQKWFEETKFTARDQISFMYIYNKFRIISLSVFSNEELKGNMINIGLNRKCKQKK